MCRKGASTTAAVGAGAVAALPGPMYAGERGVRGLAANRGTTAKEAAAIPAPAINTNPAAGRSSSPAARARGAAIRSRDPRGRGR